MTEEKTRQLNVRITDSLHNQLKDLSDEQGVAFSEVVRSVLQIGIDCDTERKTEAKQGDHEAYTEELKEQIRFLKVELQNKQDDNRELMKLLDQQQQLTLTNVKKIELLETEIDEKENKEAEKAIADEQEKLKEEIKSELQKENEDRLAAEKEKNWMQRLFNR